MAFPTRLQKRVLALVLDEAQAIAQNLKSDAERLKTKSSAGTLNGPETANFQVDAKAKFARLAVLKATPGIGQFAKDQFDDQTLDIATEFQGMLDAIQDILNWIRTNIPVSTGGFIEERKIETDDTSTLKVYTAASTSGFRTELDLLIAAIG